MKNYILTIIHVIVFLMLNCSLFSQKWEKYFGVPAHNEYVNGLTRHYDKGMYILGGVDNGDHAWNLKTDANGNLLWDKIIKHSDFVLGERAAIYDNEGNMYVTGTIWVDASRPFVAKFNACGEKEWCRVMMDEVYTFGGGGIDILVNHRGEIVVLIFLESQAQIDEIFLAVFDKSGNLLLMNSYASKENYPKIGQRSCLHIIEHNFGYYLAGYCYWPYPNNPNHVYLRPFFIGVDSVFNEKWILPFYALDSVFGDAYKTIPINDTLLMATGARKFFNSIVVSAMLYFYTIDGQEIGYKQINSEQVGPDIVTFVLDYIEKIENDSKYLVTAYWGSDYLSVPCGELVLDTTGKIYKYHSRPGLSYNSYLCKTYDNNFSLANSRRQPNSTFNDIYIYKIDENLESVPIDTNQYVYDSLCGNQIQSGEVSMDDCVIISGIDKLPGSQSYFENLTSLPIKAYPNPATAVVNLEFENTERFSSLQLRCYNMHGSLVHSEPLITSQKGTVINISHWPPGMYVAIVTGSSGASGKCKFVVEKEE